jgi:peptide/nickel transport system substrate-binding protein
LDKSAAQLFQASLAEIGYNLEINTVDTATLNDLIFGDLPGEERPMIIGSWGWFPDYNDAWNQLAPNFVESAIGGGGGNAGLYVNPRFEEIMAEGEHFDPETYDALMHEAQNILTELDPACIYLGELQFTTVLRSDIQGFVPNPLYLEAYNFYTMHRQAPA